ncbi:putative DNA maturase A [Aeromonas phage AHPMCC7]|nr:putative DNA maturase A [Aeromonas phage AHPMCC7]
MDDELIDDLPDTTAADEAADKAFMERLRSMSNEELAKLLLNESLISLARTINKGWATAADLNAARQFLKDNDIGIVPTRTNAAGKLKEALQARSASSQQSPGVIPIEELDQLDIDDFVRLQ